MKSFKKLLVCFTCVLSISEFNVAFASENASQNFTQGASKFSVFKESKNDFKLESPMISMVDGKSYGVDAQVFALMLQIRREIRKSLFGLVEEGKTDSKRAGTYDFFGKKYCLSELAEIEVSIKATDKNYKEIKDALTACLEKAKEDLISTTRVYVKGINNIKDPLLTLVEEFCDKKGLENSYLLKWGEAESGQEETMVRTQLKTLVDFGQFCIDFTDFLEVLAKSCPKGKTLFIDAMKKSKKA